MFSNGTEGFGAQLIGLIQLDVKKPFSSLCRFLGHWLDVFLPVSDKVCHSPFKKVKRQPILLISLSQQSPLFEFKLKSDVTLGVGWGVCDKKFRTNMCGSRRGLGVRMTPPGKSQVLLVSIQISI